LKQNEEFINIKVLIYPVVKNLLRGHTLYFQLYLYALPGRYGVENIAKVVLLKNQQIVRRVQLPKKPQVQDWKKESKYSVYRVN